MRLTVVDASQGDETDRESLVGQTSFDAYNDEASAINDEDFRILLSEVCTGEISEKVLIVVDGES